MSDVTKIKYCPRCGGGTNSEDMGGTEYCFHCECGFIECEDVPELNRACDTQPQSERIAYLETQLRAAEEREGKLRTDNDRMQNALEEIEAYGNDRQEIMRSVLKGLGTKPSRLAAALAAAPTQGEGITDAERIAYHEAHKYSSEPMYSLRNGREGWYWMGIRFDTWRESIDAAILAARAKESTHAD